MVGLGSQYVRRSCAAPASAPVGSLKFFVTGAGPALFDTRGERESCWQIRRRSTVEIDKKFRAAFSGATALSGSVRRTSADHPWFELTESPLLNAHPEKKYSEAVNWHLNTSIPVAAANLVVKSGTCA